MAAATTNASCAALLSRSGGLGSDSLVTAARLLEMGIVSPKSLCRLNPQHFRRFATRFDRRSIYFLAFIHLASAILWMR